MQRNLAAVLLVLGGVAGCSLAGEEYSVPERVCGVSVSEEVVRSVLPEGEKLTEYGESLPEKYNVCGLVVDNEPTVRIAFGAEPEFYEPLQAWSEKFRGGEEIALELPGAGGLDDDNAMIILKCGLPRRPHIIANIQIPPPGGVSANLSRADLKRFAVAYMAGARKVLGCPQGNASAGS